MSRHSKQPIAGSWPALVAMAAAVVLLADVAWAEGPSLRLVHGFGPDHPVQLGVERFVGHLDGTWTIEIEEWGTDPEAVRALRAGEIGFAVVRPSSLRNIAREATLLELMALWKSHEHWANALDGELGRKLAERVLKASQDGQGAIHVLGFWGGSESHLLTRGKPIADLTSLVDLRLCTPLDPVRSKMWRSLGVKRVFCESGDEANALAAGRADGLDTTLSEAYRVDATGDGLTLGRTGHAIDTQILVMAHGRWLALSAAKQTAVGEAARDATRVARQAARDGDAKAIAVLRGRAGTTVSEFPDRSAFRTRMGPFHTRFADELGALDLLTLVESAAAPPRP